MVESIALDQVKMMMNHEITENTKVQLMTDIHFGKGATVGTLIKLLEDREEWKVSPNVVGVDIRCGMLSYKLKLKNNDRFDEKNYDSLMKRLTKKYLQVSSS